MIAREPRVVLMSVHPRWAWPMVHGEKTIEVRRRPVALARGDTLFVYASSPVCAVIGRAVVDHVVSASPAALWELIDGRRTTRLLRIEFDEYLEGVDRACGVVIARATPLSRPVALDELRAAVPGFHPPQTYCHLQSRDAARRVLRARLLAARVRGSARRCA